MRISLLDRLSAAIKRRAYNTGRATAYRDIHLESSGIFTPSCNPENDLHFQHGFIGNRDDRCACRRVTYGEWRSRPGGPAEMLAKFRGEVT